LATIHPANSCVLLESSYAKPCYAPKSSKWASRTFTLWKLIYITQVEIPAWLTLDDVEESWAARRCFVNLPYEWTSWMLTNVQNHPSTPCHTEGLASSQHEQKKRFSGLVEISPSTRATSFPRMMKSPSSFCHESSAHTRMSWLMMCFLHSLSLRQDRIILEFSAISANVADGVNACKP